MPERTTSEMAEDVIRRMKSGELDPVEGCRILRELVDQSSQNYVNQRRRR